MMRVAVLVHLHECQKEVYTFVTADAIHCVVYVSTVLIMQSGDSMRCK